MAKALLAAALAALAAPAMAQADFTGTWERYPQPGETPDPRWAPTPPPNPPLKDEWLWLSREIDYGRDPAAWFEITWFADPT